MRLSLSLLLSVWTLPDQPYADTAPLFDDPLCLFVHNNVDLQSTCVLVRGMDFRL